MPEGKAIINGIEETVSIGDTDTPQPLMTMEELMSDGTPGLSGPMPDIARRGTVVDPIAEPVAKPVADPIEEPVVEAAVDTTPESASAKLVTAFLEEKGVAYEVKEDGTISYDPEKAKELEVTPEMILSAGVEADPAKETKEKGEEVETMFTGDDVLSALHAKVPGMGITDPEGIADYVAEVAQRASVVEDMAAMIQDNPELGEYIRLVHTQGMTPRLAASSAFSELAKKPDIDEEPELYAKWSAQQATVETERRMLKERGGAFDVQNQARSVLVDKTLDGFLVRHNDKYPDRKKNRVDTLAEFNSFFHGDPATGGTFRPDAFDVLDRGINSKFYIKEAEEAAVTKAMAALATGDTEAQVQIAPTLGGGGGEIQTTTETSLSRFEEALGREPEDRWARVLGDA